MIREQQEEMKTVLHEALYVALYDVHMGYDDDVECAENAIAHDAVFGVNKNDPFDVVRDKRELVRRSELR